MTKNVFAVFEELEDEDKIVFNSNNVRDSLSVFARKHKVHMQDLDFDVTRCTTMYRDDGGEWLPMDEDHLSQPDFMEEFARSEAEMSQTYDILIKPKAKNSDFRPDIAFLANQLRTRLQATIKGTSYIRPAAGLYEALHEEITKRELLMGVIVGVFDYDLEKNLNDLINKISQAGGLKEDVSIVVAAFPDPIESSKDKLILKYEENRDPKTAHQVYPSITKDEVIIEYTKPIPGKPGRNLFGKSITISNAEQKHRPNFSKMENVKVEEDAEKVLFIAEINGYVKHDPGSLVVTDTLEVKRINFKETGSVEGEDETNIKISDSDALHEGVDSGVTVEADKIELNGNIGAGAKVICKILEVRGNTHKKAHIEARQAKIKLHRGYLEGRQAIVGRLEHGVIKAHEIKLNEAIGGEIHGKKISINSLNSHTKIFATGIVMIKNVLGECNLITINTEFETSKHLGRIETVDDKLLRLRAELAKLDKEFKSKTDEFKKDQTEIKRAMMMSKTKGGSLPALIQNKKKAADHLQRELGTLRQELLKKRDEVNKVEHGVTEKQTSTLQSKVMCANGWKPANRIKFILHNPKREKEYIPKVNDREIWVEEDDEGQMVIKTRQ